MSPKTPATPPAADDRQELVFTAAEYRADTSFAAAEFRFAGSPTTGWKIERDGLPHLSLGPG